MPFGILIWTLVRSLLMTLLVQGTAVTAGLKTREGGTRIAATLVSLSDPAASHIHTLVYQIDALVYQIHSHIDTL